MEIVEFCSVWDGGGRMNGVKVELVRCKDWKVGFSKGFSFRDCVV